MTCVVDLRGWAQLWVNASGLSPRGRLKVELLDEREQAIAGYAGSQAAYVASSGFRSPGVWKRGERIEGLGKRFKIEVTFEGPDRESIKFYALYLGQRSTNH